MKRKYARLHNEKILVLINGWGCPTWLFRFIKNILPKSCGYIEYHYNKEEICLNPEHIRTKLNFIAQRIKKDITDLNKFKERKLYLYTLSLGAIFGMILVDELKIEKTAMVMPIYDLAETFWRLNRKDTEKIKNYFIRNNWGIEKLRRTWSEFNIRKYFQKKSLKTKFLFRLSKKDWVLKPEHKTKFINFLKKRRINFIVEEKSLTHRWNGFFSILFPKKTINFLLS